MNVREIYEGSNGDATKALYAELERRGPLGIVALNLFRAHKCSARAKVYRGGAFKRDAYDRKNYSIGELIEELTKFGDSLGIRFGWKCDPAQEFHKWVLYVDLPTGQVSFHCAARMSAHHYFGEWDGIRDVGAARIIAFTERVLLDGTQQIHAPIVCVPLYPPSEILPPSEAMKETEIFVVNIAVQQPLL